MNLNTFLVIKSEADTYLCFNKMGGAFTSGEGAGPMKYRWGHLVGWTNLRNGLRKSVIYCHNIDSVKIVKNVKQK